MAEVGPINQEQFDEVISLYERVGYGAGLATDDLVIGARVAHDLVGVVRLATENEILLLRGMYVLNEFQRQGIGLAMLHAVEDFLGNRECWCIPYAHLGSFYMNAGFVERTIDAAPGFLAERLKAYSELGRQVILMHRAAGD